MLIDSDDLNRIPLHEFLRTDEIELEGLFENAGRRIRQRFEAHGRRVDIRSNIRKRVLIPPSNQLDPA
jgi:hypothetical protein